MSDCAICTENLTRDFGAVRALDGVSLEVPAGTIFGFLGPNGAGKTTMIRLLLGLLEPSGGRASVMGFDTRRAAGDIRARTGALLEHHGLYERLSAQDNLDFYGRIYKMTSRQRGVRIEELLGHLGLWDRRRESVARWSKGMKQKLAIARALLHRPPLVFLDEPTAGLDAVAAAALRDDLLGLGRHEGVTIFLTTHNMSEAERLCRRVGVIRQGKLIATGHPDDLRSLSGGSRAEIFGQGFSPVLLARLRERPEVASVALENGHLLVDLREKAKVAPIVSFLVTEGAEIEEVRKGMASLEHAFLTLMEQEQ